jgi:hypothetical protein
MPASLVMPGTADVLPVTVTGSYAKLGDLQLCCLVERYPLCGASQNSGRCAVMAVPAMTCFLQWASVILVMPSMGITELR